MVPLSKQYPNSNNNMHNTNNNNNTNGSDYQSSAGKSSNHNNHAPFVIKPLKISGKSVGQGLLPPRPVPTTGNSTNKLDKKAVGKQMK